jgi:hypothetical protein
MIVASGRIARLSHDLIDENHKGLTFWIDKHNHYSDREVMSIDAASGELPREHVGGAVARKRFLKNAIYGRLPLFLRAITYGLVRYFVLLGFLDGRAGFVFHFLQGFWYRLIIDAKLYERRTAAKLASSCTESDKTNKMCR